MTPQKYVPILIVWRFFGLAPADYFAEQHISPIYFMSYFIEGPFYSHF